jgi:hypothetical protein
MPSKRPESVFSHETAEMKSNLLLRREDIFSHVPCTRDLAKFLKEMRDSLGLFSSSNRWANHQAYLVYFVFLGDLLEWRSMRPPSSIEKNSSFAL